MLRAIHAIAAVIAFLTILLFWSATAVSGVFGSPGTVAAVKMVIAWGLTVLIPALVLVGASGMALGRHRQDMRALRKKRRLPVIAANGLVILAPCAVFLSVRTASGTFDGWFYGIQSIELVAGAANLTLLGLSMRDGLAMTGRLRRRQAGPHSTHSVPR